MNIKTGQTTEWLDPTDAEETVEYVESLGYELGPDEAFVITRTSEAYGEFLTIYKAGLAAKEAS